MDAGKVYAVVRRPLLPGAEIHPVQDGDMCIHKVSPFRKIYRMFQILFLLFFGTVTGFALRRVPLSERGLGTGIHCTVLALLFVFGVSLGSDRSLADNFAATGWQAFVIAFFGTIGSYLVATLFNRLLSGRKGGRR